MHLVAADSCSGPMDVLVFDKPFTDGPLLSQSFSNSDFSDLNDPFLASLLEDLEGADFIMEDQDPCLPFLKEDPNPSGCCSQEGDQPSPNKKEAMFQDPALRFGREPVKFEQNSCSTGPTQEEEGGSFNTYYKLARSPSFVSASAKGATRYACPFPGCSNTCPNKESLFEHMELHRAGRAKHFDCKKCNAVFYSFGGLKSHHATHSKGRHRYFCNKANCGKSYATVEGLRLHNRNYHEINKPWRCFHSDCGASFVRKSDLKLHIVRMHISERPFPCTIHGCTRRFACHSELRRHLSKFHRIKLPKPSKHSFQNPKLPVLDKLLRMAEVECTKKK